VEAADAAIDHLLLEAGGPVWTEADFDALVIRLRARFVPTATEVVELVGQIVATVGRVEARLSTMLAASLDETVVDVQAHVRRLLHRGWITAAGVDRLPDVLRYARGIEHRVDKAAAQPDRDRARIAALRGLEQEYRQVAARDLDGRVRWMLEELRVSTFAQTVGVRGGASEQKVKAELARLAP
jgi:ATP-dependent helicase HrpA